MSNLNGDIHVTVTTTSDRRGVTASSTTWNSELSGSVSPRTKSSSARSRRGVPDTLNFPTSARPLAPDSFGGHR
jgi:hypothetical protein